MSAARYDLVIDQGSDFAIEFTVDESGTVKNLTGYYLLPLPVLFQHLQMVKLRCHYQTLLLRL